MAQLRHTTNTDAGRHLGLLRVTDAQIKRAQAVVRLPTEVRARLQSPQAIEWAKKQHLCQTSLVIQLLPLVLRECVIIDGKIKIVPVASRVASTKVATK